MLSDVNSGMHSTFYACAIQYSAGDFFDGEFCGIHEWNLVSTEYFLGFAKFEADLLSRRIIAHRPAFFADLLQPLRLERQTEQFLLRLDQEIWQRPVLKFINRQRIVRRVDDELQRKVQARRRYP